MATQSCSIDTLLSLYDTQSSDRLRPDYIIIDVRSEGEYAHAHIPGAISIPIFNDDERKEIGTAYKQVSRDTAIHIGLEYFGSKMSSIIEEVERLVPDKARTQIIVHCWRGGMRSAAFTWLLSFCGYQAMQLTGGYKEYRRWALAQYDKPYSLITIGGNTGSAKTEVLHALADKGKHIIDLEGIAVHRGSAYGAIDGHPQPSQESFENMLALELYLLSQLGDHIIIEDESRRIGSVNIPLGLWTQMRSQRLIFLDIPFHQRLAHIVSEYSTLPKALLISNTERIQKRLGGDGYRAAITHLEHDEYEAAFSILLAYYDKYYHKGLHTREHLDKQMTTIPSHTIDAVHNASLIIQSIDNTWSQ